MTYKNLDQFKKYMDKIRPCIICNGTHFETWARLDYFEAKKCKDCGMISVNPHLNNEGLSLFYEGYYSNRLNNEETLFEQRKIVYEIDRKWITKFIDSGKVLDVGCAGGQFLSTFDQKKWERHGIEIEKDAAEYAKKEYGINVRIGFLPELSINETFDLIILRGVIEHISDPISFLKKCVDILRPGGYLFITATPAGDSFAFYIYREKWHLFTPPEHLHFFTISLLSRKLMELGLTLVEHHYQYDETPYANIPKDYAKIQNDIILSHLGKRNEIQGSPPFPGSMITAVWKKDK